MIYTHTVLNLLHVFEEDRLCVFFFLVSFCFFFILGKYINQHADSGRSKYVSCI